MPLLSQSQHVRSSAPASPFARAWLPLLAGIGLGACASHGASIDDFELVDAEDDAPSDAPPKGPNSEARAALLVASTAKGALAILDEHAAVVRPSIPLGAARGLALAPGGSSVLEVFALARGEDDEAGSELVRIGLDGQANLAEWGWFGGDSTIASSPLGPLVASRELGTRWVIATGPNARSVSVACPAPAALVAVASSAGEAHAWVGLGRDALGAWVRIDASVDVDAGLTCATTPLAGEALDDDRPAFAAGRDATITIAHSRHGEVVLDRLDGSTLAPTVHPAIAADHVVDALALDDGAIALHLDAPARLAIVRGNDVAIVPLTQSNEPPSLEARPSLASWGARLYVASAAGIEAFERPTGAHDAPTLAPVPLEAAAAAARPPLVVLAPSVRNCSYHPRPCEPSAVRRSSSSPPSCSPRAPSPRATTAPSRCP